MAGDGTESPVGYANLVLVPHRHRAIDHPLLLGMLFGSVWLGRETTWGCVKRRERG